MDGWMRGRVREGEKLKTSLQCSLIFPRRRSSQMKRDLPCFRKSSMMAARDGSCQRGSQQSLVCVSCNHLTGCHFFSSACFPWNVFIPHVEFTWFSGRVIYCLGSNYQNFLSSLLYFAKDGKRHILNKTVLRHKSSGELAHERRRGDTVPNWQRGAVSSELSHPALHKHRRLCPAVQSSGRISISVLSLPNRRMSSEVHICLFLLSYFTQCASNPGANRLSHPTYKKGVDF